MMETFELKQTVLKQRCVTCNEEFKVSTDTRTCPADGTILSPVFDDPLIGKVIDEKFEIRERIAIGAKAKIYRARHAHLDKSVVLKVLQAGLDVTQEQVARFQKEAQVAVKLSHPNIVRVNDYGTHPQPYIVMEYLEGKTLAALIKEGGALPPAKALPLFLNICDAMSTSHAAGLVHRDLKPSNIMVDSQTNEAKVLDFGLVKDFVNDGQYTRTGETVGSPPYMSPEQCRGEPLTAQSDVYSMGCLMYEALTQSCPFAGANTVESIFKHLETTAPPLAKVRKDVKFPPGMQKVIDNCLAKDQGHRYQSMDALKQDLLAVQSGAGKRVKFCAPPIRSRPAIGSWLILGLLLCLSVVTMIYQREREKHTPDWQKAFKQGIDLQINQGDNRGSISPLLKAEQGAQMANASPAVLEDIYGYLGQGYEDDQPKKAIDYLNRALRINSKHAEDVPRSFYRYSLASAYMALNDYDSALKHEQIALDIASRLSTNPGRLSSYHKRLGHIFIKLKRYSEAIQPLEQARKFALQARSGGPIFDGFIRVLLRGDPTFYYDVSLAASLVDIDTSLGLAYFETARKKDSSEAFGHALTLAAYSAPEKLSDLTDALIPLLKDNQTLDALAETATRQHWDPTLLPLVRGLALTDQKKYELALAQFDQALKENSKASTSSAPANWMRAWIFACKATCNRYLDKTSEAIDNYKQALLLESNYQSLYKELAACLMQAGRYDEAVSAWGSAIKSAPNNSHNHFFRGLSFFATEKFDPAAKDFATFLEHTKDRCKYRPYSAMLLTLAYRFSGKPQAAHALLASLDQKCDTNAWPYPIIRYLGKHISAQELQKSAGKDDTKRADASTYLGLDCLARGDENQGRQYLQQTLKFAEKRSVEYQLAAAFLARRKIAGAN